MRRRARAGAVLPDMQGSGGGGPPGHRGDDPACASDPAVAVADEATILIASSFHTYRLPANRLSYSVLSDAEFGDKTGQRDEEFLGVAPDSRATGAKAPWQLYVLSAGAPPRRTGRLDARLRDRWAVSLGEPFVVPRQLAGLAYGLFTGACACPRRKDFFGAVKVGAAGRAAGRCLLG